MATYWDYPTGNLDLDLIPSVVTDHARRLCQDAGIKYPGLSFRNLPGGGVRISTGSKNEKVASRIINLLIKATPAIDADISAAITGIRVKDGIVYDDDTGEPISDDL